MAIYFSNHARQRFKERFRLLFNKEIFLEDRDVYLLRKLFMESTPIDFAFKQRIGDYNAACIEQGSKIHVNRRGNMIFVWSVGSKGDTIVKTIMKDSIKIRGVVL